MSALVLANNEFKDPEELCPTCLSNCTDMELSCGHRFHLSCLEQQIEEKWTGVRITFNFMKCPICRKEMNHIKLQNFIQPFIDLRDKIKVLANEVINDEPELPVGDDDTVLNVLAFYQCQICSEPFCGGLVSCAEEMEKIDENLLKCQKCVFAQDQDVVYEDFRCFEHGYTYALFKCDSCCSFATYDCIYNHYCDRCHAIPTAAKEFPCSGKATCPLGIHHPPNKEAIHSGYDNSIVPYILGCMKCWGVSDVPNQDFGERSSAKEAFKSKSLNYS